MIKKRQRRHFANRSERIRSKSEPQTGMQSGEVRSTSEQPDLELEGYFGVGIVATKQFQRAWKRLPADLQAIAREKIVRLQIHPQHRSLRVHRVKRARNGVHECSLSRTYRILYRREAQNMLILVNIGGHGVVDHAHARGCNAS